MQWIINEKVVYLPTGESATIIRIVEDDLVYIRMDADKSSIPALSEDLGRVKEGPVLPDINDSTLPESLSLCFQYKMYALDEIKKIPVFLANGMKHDIGYDINFYTADTEPMQLRGRVRAGMIELVQELPVELLHHTPVYEIDWSYLDISGVHTADISIKPAQFFNKYGKIDFLQSQGSLYSLSTDIKKPGNKQESLKEYAKKARKQVSVQPIKDPSWDLKAKAGFDNVLDLHIEKLTNEPGKYNSGEKLRLQLAKFDQFLDQAVRLGIKQVFVVHGIGKGKLKDEINTRLIQDYRVHVFSNDFQERFGYGATEIWLY